MSSSGKYRLIEAKYNHLWTNRINGPTKNLDIVVGYIAFSLAYNNARFYIYWTGYEISIFQKLKHKHCTLIIVPYSLTRLCTAHLPRKIVIKHLKVVYFTQIRILSKSSNCLTKECHNVQGVWFERDSLSTVCGSPLFFDQSFSYGK